jgi:hypothetical protein
VCLRAEQSVPPDLAGVGRGSEFQLVLFLGVGAAWERAQKSEREAAHSRDSCEVVELVIPDDAGVILEVMFDSE